MTRVVWLWVIGMLVQVGFSHAQGASNMPTTLSVDDRLSGLVQLWSVAKTNFVFEQKLPGLDWNALLMEYLPLVRAEQSDRDYYRVLTRFLGSVPVFSRLTRRQVLRIQRPGVVPTNHDPDKISAGAENSLHIVEKKRDQPLAEPLRTWGQSPLFP